MRPTHHTGLSVLNFLRRLVGNFFDFAHTKSGLPSNKLELFGIDTRVYYLYLVIRTKGPGHNNDVLKVSENSWEFQIFIVYCWVNRFSCKRSFAHIESVCTRMEREFVLFLKIVWGGSSAVACTGNLMVFSTSKFIYIHFLKHWREINVCMCVCACVWVDGCATAINRFFVRYAAY